MKPSIRVFEEHGDWKVRENDGEPLTFETREEAMGAAALLADQLMWPVEIRTSRDAREG